VLLQVWRAHWGELDVAVKILRHNMLHMDSGTVQEFEREVEFMQRTRHPSIVKFFGAGRMPDGAPFLVAELMASSLKVLLRGNHARPLSWDVKASIALDVASGMSHIHSLGHIHRDLKSANVLVSSSRRAKVADFGSIGQLLRRGPMAPMALPHDKCSSSRQAPASSSSSHFGTVREMTSGVGTPIYMSPEALTGTNYGQTTDVFSYGVLLWEVASQQAPDLLAQEKHPGRGPISQVQYDLLKAGNRLRLEPAWPAGWQAVIPACWAEDATQRPTFAELQQQLTSIELLEPAKA